MCRPRSAAKLAARGGGEDQPIDGIARLGLLLALPALWGGSFFFVEIAVDELPPLTTVTLRVGIAALVLLVIVREEDGVEALF